MRVFQSRWFQRFSRKEGIDDHLLLDAITRAESGQIDADLGGEVIKQRIARPGQGKSRGYRTIILFRHRNRAFFVYGFSKSRMANIDREETVQFREAAAHVLSLSDLQLRELLKRGDFVEVKGE